MLPNGGRKHNASATAGHRKRKLSSHTLVSADKVAHDAEDTEGYYDGDGTGSIAPSSFTLAQEEIIPSSHRKPVIQRLSEGKRLKRIFAKGSGFDNQILFKGHRSCINTLAFSRGQGRWLADAGDDLKIYIRDVLEGPGQLSAQFPVLELHGHESNIFSLSWSAQNKYLYSAGNDGRILQYDLQHSPVPVLEPSRERTEKRMYSDLGVLGSHHESIPEISSHPTNPQLVLSCDDNGKLKLIDTRMPHPCVASQAFAQAAFSSVQWNPNEADGNTFAASTASPVSGTTRLYDVRRCFSSSQNGKLLTPQDAVVNYHTDLLQNSKYRGYISGRAETNSVCFDPSGKMLAASLSRFAPTLYAVGDPDPLALLESGPVYSHRPGHSKDDVMELKSNCTIKHGSFGFDAQLDQLHYAIGSDDFRTYVFEIPDIETLKARREFLNLSSYIEATTRDHQAAKRGQTHHDESCSSTDHDASSDEDSYASYRANIDLRAEILYTQGPPSHCQNVIRPVTLDNPAYILTGASSIINVTAFHPTLNWIATAGIENCVRLYSSGPFRFGWPHKPPSKRVDATRSRPCTSLGPSLSNLQDSDAEDTSDDEDFSPSSELFGRRSVEPHGHRFVEPYPTINDSDYFTDDGSDQDQGISDQDTDGQEGDFEQNSEEGGATVQDQGSSVHDFLAAMRTDPLFATPSLHTLDDQGDDDTSIDDQDYDPVTAPSQSLPITVIRNHFGRAARIFKDTHIDTESDWTTDEDLAIRREVRYDRLYNRHGSAAMYVRHQAWADRKARDSAMAEARRIALFDQILTQDEDSHVLDNFLSCSLNLPPDSP